MFNAQQLDYLHAVINEKLDQLICADFDSNLQDIKYCHELLLVICSRYEELKNEQTAGN
jgi:hypothetical protein|tara:strand:- start:420 stop:596 length:177 start_codon:yes stop_codon:yes gene_type:complete